MKELTKETIDEFLKEYMPDSSETLKDNAKKQLNEKINSYIEKKAILGFDINRYSQYPSLEQTLIPHLFKKLYNLAIRDCLKNESLIFFSKTEEDFKAQFIDQGDGGFQIFDNPFQALIFSIYFQAIFKRYNSGHEHTKALHNIIREITLKYSLTYDSTYFYGKNYYGRSIINNARIMAKDTLNRFLIDENTVNWFTQEFNGLENLQVITLEKDFKNINILKENIDIENSEKTLLFRGKKSAILKVDLMRIGEIKSKLDTLSIHSVHMQILMETTSKEKLFNKYTISLGNLNSSGIT